jgi:hypothetical protein
MLYDLCTGLFLAADWGHRSLDDRVVYLGRGTVHSLVQTIDVIALKLQLETIQYCGSLVLRSLAINRTSLYCTASGTLPPETVCQIALSFVRALEGIEGKTSKFGAGWPQLPCNKKLLPELPHPSLIQETLPVCRSTPP